MKKITILVKYDEEKHKALEQYLVKKGMSIESEVGEKMDALYKKHVPLQVQEYIAERGEQTCNERNSGNRRPD
ncbi:MAG: DUF6103 family protein [Saccharofermentanales bacterium]